MSVPNNHFYLLKEMAYQEKRPGVWLKTMSAVRSQLCLTKLAAGTQTMHSHHQEQLGYILAGAATVTIGTEEKLLGPGDGYTIPADEVHGFRVPMDTDLEYVEVFCPPKEENEF
jgi:mannose-6-phosphate isomerase-like protein (cupin superfamily)